MGDKTLQSEIYQNCYVISAGFDIDDLLSVLKEKYVYDLQQVTQLKLIYFDTFDWRLYQQDRTLVLRQQGQIQKLELEKLSNASVLAAAPLTRPFDKISSSDLVPSALRTTISPIIEMRALLPVLSIMADSQRLLLRDKHDKVVVRLSIEQKCQAWTDTKRKRTLAGRIVLEPVRGYQSEQQQVDSILNHIKGLVACKMSLLDVALQACGRQANDYSSKVKIKLKPESQSVQAVKNILQHLLLTMERNETGMLASLDTEFLHDYRVSVRRMRSLLSQMKGVLPKAEFELLKTELAWLGAITTPARDLDVYLLEFETLQNSLPTEMHDSLLPFRDFLLQQQEQAYAELSEGLNSDRYERFKQALQGFLNGKLETIADLAPNAKKDIHGQADERIWRSYSRVMKQAGHLKSDSAAEKFHELRKSCKKLRYLLEFFNDLYPGKEIAVLISQLKIMQDKLGEFQDMDVQSHALRDFARQMAEQGLSNADTFMAMGVLADSMEQRKTRLQHEFIDCYKIFSKQKHQKLFRKLFKPHVNPKQEAVHESAGKL